MAVRAAELQQRYALGRSRRCGSLTLTAALRLSDRLPVAIVTGPGAGKLRGPNLLPPVEAGREWAVSVRPAGQSLAKLLAWGTCEPAEALRILLDAAEALAPFHSLRDPAYFGEVVPRALVCAGGQHYVLNLGTLVFPERGLYAAPEAEESPGPAADVFSMGSILHHAIAGAPPAPGMAPGVPEHLAALVATAIAPDPARRYPDALALKTALREASVRHQLYQKHRFPVVVGPPPRLPGPIGAQAPHQAGESSPAPDTEPAQEPLPVAAPDPAPASATAVAIPDPAPAPVRHAESPGIPVAGKAPRGRRLRAIWVWLASVTFGALAGFGAAMFFAPAAATPPGEKAMAPAQQVPGDAQPQAAATEAPKPQPQPQPSPAASPGPARLGSDVALNFASLLPVDARIWLDGKPADDRVAAYTVENHVFIFKGDFERLFGIIANADIDRDRVLLRFHSRSAYTDLAYIDPFKRVLVGVDTRNLQLADLELADISSDSQGILLVQVRRQRP